jgi:hypothetical protein
MRLPVVIPRSQGRNKLGVSEQVPGESCLLQVRLVKQVQDGFVSWQCKKCVSFAKHQMEVSSLEHSRECRGSTMSRD